MKRKNDSMNKHMDSQQSDANKGKDNRGASHARSIKDDRRAPHTGGAKDDRRSSQAGGIKDDRRASHTGRTKEDSSSRLAENPKETLQSLCRYTGKCGGCANTGIPYEKQLEAKQHRIEALFREFNCPVERIIGSDSPFHYRNKVHSVFSRDKNGKVIRGMYAQESHKVINVSGCLLEDKTADAIINEVKRLASVYKMKIYDEDTQTGFLRHVLVRAAQYHGTGSYMVVIVTAEVQFEGKNNFVKLLKNKFPEISTIIQNINNKRTSMVLGERNITIYGKGYVVDDSLGFEFRISPSAFFQINSAQTRKLYETALKMAAPKPDDTVLDAYCGTGTIGMFLSRASGHVTGVELNPDAVRDAVDNAKRNMIDNIEFVCADATEYMSDKANFPKVPDILCMDPPRSGSTPEFINAAADLGISRIVYVSCDPETLVRDIKLFRKRGYGIERVVPVDMFPMTEHCETVCLLKKIADLQKRLDSQYDIMDDVEHAMAEVKISRIGSKQ